MSCFLLTLQITICVFSPMTDLLSAIQAVETPAGINLDLNHDHIGPYQISYAYWLDSGVPGQWEDCLNSDYSQQVMMAYWERYVPEALAERDYEVLARTHYGGPGGVDKKSTLSYWELVQEEIKNDLDKRKTIRR